MNGVRSRCTDVQVCVLMLDRVRVMLLPSEDRCNTTTDDRQCEPVRCAGSAQPRGRVDGARHYSLRFRPLGLYLNGTEPIASLLVQLTCIHRFGKK